MSLMAVILLCAGCLGGGVPEGARPSPATAPLERPASGRNVDVGIPGLAVVLPKVFDRLEWAELRLGNELTALHAAALMPDGRTFHIRAQSAADGGSRVQARAGHFGDDALERRFFEALRREVRERMREARKKR